MSEKMQALVVTKPGGPEVLKLREVRRPRLRDELDVLIRVKAAGINPADWQNRKNGAVYDSEGGSLSEPTILGIDGVGVVVEAGEEVTNVRVGDEVWYVDGGYAGNPGSYAEYKVIRADYVTAKPGTLDFAEAAALPVVALTAWEAVFDKGRVGQGDYVLVHGGAGGLGHVAIQYLAALGARIATTVSSEQKAELVRKLGAELVINYRSEKVEEALHSWRGEPGANVVFDFVGHGNFAESFRHTGSYGRLVNTVVSDWPVGGNGPAEWKNMDISFVNIGLPQISRDHAQRLRQTVALKRIAELVDRGGLRAHIDRVVSFSGVGEAQRALEAGETMGRPVLLI
ncbi:quinone oxidoreductase family protein [Sinorhizobium meliloti]|uniref:quinone oxidoreductase family protein n=1 Tax=Rhizobium meliloti TaxID=382 RepID=UPI0004878B54|nr:zinc-binding dehydrogenase [Sinorhizobium meliloti]MDE3819652.1 zinc-binding dehydrogenase [Sinorhizobium meliloti]MDE4618150.1 zinc-binding dehydrogenase [Sinorhizobium meliloti]MDW9984222.1 zinc-binding dehydrogenase [Sinorhizobium meliloti]MDX0269943.1 zinc-binding dehydrogenase [Sinorhizobium meliloti]RVH98442.1 alcohol dehydrogenase [Sinorhizobium meliloti]